MKPNARSPQQNRSVGRPDSGTRAGGREAKTWRNAVWLADRDIRRTWVSFPIAALVALVFGLYTGGFLFSENLTNLTGSSLISTLLDFWFLGLTPILAVNFVGNRDYYYSLNEDNFSKRLAFLRKLPISMQTVVLGRAAYMLVVLAVCTPVFFLTLYLISGEIRGRLDPLEYLCFVAVWIGWIFAACGFYLYLWHRTLKTQLRTIPVMMVVFPIIAGICNFVLGFGIVAETLVAASQYGLVFALAALLVGSLSFLLWMRAAARHLENKKELF